MINIAEKDASSKEICLQAALQLIAAMTAEGFTSSNKATPQHLPQFRTEQEIHSEKNVQSLGLIARRLYRARRKRDSFFDATTLFGEPAWDILLDLYIAAEEKKQISVTSATIAASVPPTTGLRWIAALVDEGLLTRESDPQDARRSIVSLSQKGYAAMHDYLSSQTNE